MSKHFLVIGSGEIAQRHINNFYELFPDGRVTLVKRKNSLTPVNVKIENIINDFKDINTKIIDAVLIASPSPFHKDAAVYFLNNKVPIFIEKPIAHNSIHAKDIIKAANKNNDAIILVGYCLRYTNSLRAFKDVLDKSLIGEIFFAQVIASNYLPDWRPNINYKNSVSAQKKLGGGVMLELSHELDYIQWIFGDIKSMGGIINNHNNLEMDVPNIADLVMLTNKNITINCHLDMLTKKPKRFCRVIASKGWAEWNFLGRQVSWQENKKIKKISFSGENQTMYKEELKYFFELVDKKTNSIISAEESYKVIKSIEKIIKL